jgi:fumarylacetoacetate (FAA) hydrolase family protein
VDACIERAMARLDAVVVAIDDAEQLTESISRTIVGGDTVRVVFAGTDLPAAHVLDRVKFGAAQRAAGIMADVMRQRELSEPKLAEAIRGGYLETLLIGIELGAQMAREREAERRAGSGS